MKKVIVLSLLLIGIVSFSQTPPKPKTKDIDKEANRILDSLSNIYSSIEDSVLRKPNRN
jgi:hypothetical protein